METVISTCILLAYFAWFSLGGVIEAVLWSKKAYDAFKWNEHTLLILNRLFIGATIWFPPMSNWDRGLLTAVAGFGFFFFYESGYLLGRHFIDKPDYHIDTDSKTSSAQVNIPWNARVLLLITGVAIYLGYVFIFREFCQ